MKVNLHELIRLAKKSFFILKTKGFKALLREYENKRKLQKDNLTNLSKHQVHALKELSKKENSTLEKKMVWFFGSPRGGTTWLGTQLLDHADNIIWKEPYIGQLIDLHRSWGKDGYHVFFSSIHKINWLMPLKKLILARTYSHTSTITKNVIIKEPNGSSGADIIMECFPNSKLIFLLRDGRDVVDSFIDAHKPDSWNDDLKPYSSSEEREELIKKYSYQWKRTIKIVTAAYSNHNHNLRYMLKYEDLRTNTFYELKKIYNFLNIDITEKHLQEIINKYDFKNIPETEKGSGKFTRQATPGGWKTNLTKNEQKVMTSIMQDVLEKNGYTI